VTLSDAGKLGTEHMVSETSDLHRVIVVGGGAGGLELVTRLGSLQTGRRACAYRKSNPAILMVQSAQDRAADDIPGPLNAARGRGILVQ